MSPLPVEVLERIRGQLKEGEVRLKELNAEINEARTAGIDVTDFAKEAEQLKRSISQLKAVYGGK